MTKHEDQHERREQILRSAVACFARIGYSSATTKEIARDAGLSEGAMFRYFPTKRDILTSIMMRFADIIADQLSPIQAMLATDEDRDLREMLSSLMLDRVRFVNRVFPMARIALSEILYYEDIRQILVKKVVEPMVASYTVFHNKMVQRGKIRADIPPEAVIRSIVANVMVFIMQHKLFGEEQTEEQMAEEFTVVMDLIINGIAPMNERKGKEEL